MALARWTRQQVLEQLDAGQRWPGASIGYSFPLDPTGLNSQGESRGFRAVSAAQQDTLRLALQTWDDLIPQGFVPAAAGSSALEFGNTAAGIGFARSYGPPLGSVWLNPAYQDLSAPAPGSGGFLTLLHEIGHALGLRHMGNDGGDGPWTPSSFQDSQVLSVMSYQGPRGSAPYGSPDIMPADWVDAQGRGASPQTPMPNDVMAIQAIYGASTTTRGDDTVYGFNSTVSGALGAIYDFSRNVQPILTIFDSGGVDTLDLSGWTARSRIDLRPGGFSSGNGMTNHLAIAEGTLIENARGGAGADLLIGNDAANRLEGGPGDDELYGGAGDDVLVPGRGNDIADGGAGDDTVVFGFAFDEAVVVAGASGTKVVGPDGTVRLVSVEHLTFADGPRAVPAAVQRGAGDLVASALSPDDYPADASTAGVVEAGGGSARGLVETAGDVDFFRVVLGAGQPYQFVLQRGADGLADPLLALRGPDLALLASDDDSGGAGNARIAFTPTVGGTYFLAAADQGTGTGAYALSALPDDAVAPGLRSVLPADEASAVTTASVLELRFSEAVRAGGGALRLLDGSGQLLREIAAADTDQVRISGDLVVIAPQAGLRAGTAYSVQIDPNAFRDIAGNAFAGIADLTSWNFRTSAAPAAGDDFPLSTATSGRVVPGGLAVSARIDAVGDGDLFKADLSAGITYRIEMTRAADSAVDPAIVLHGPQPDTRLLAFDADGGTEPGDALLYFTPSQTATYFVAARDEAEGTGSYQLRISVPTDDQPAAATTGGRLAVGGSAAGSIGVPTDADWFAVSLQAGQAYAFDLQSAAGGLQDPYLVLFAGDGTALAWDDDSGGGFDARISFAAPAGGTYYLGAADYAVGTGLYTIAAAVYNIVTGGGTADVLRGTVGRDLLRGGAGSDELSALAGDDRIEGGPGIDSAVYAGRAALFDWQPLAGAWLLQDASGAEGIDNLVGVERLRFADQRIALDLDGSAGTTVKILGAVFGATYVSQPAYVGVGLQLLDGGMDEATLWRLALDARLGASASDAAVVELLWTNLLGSPPTAAERSVFVDAIRNGSFTPVSLAQAAGETSFNLVNIGFEELQLVGVAYSG